MLTAFLDDFAAHRPDAPALAFGDRQTSWSALRRRVDGLAAVLRDLGLCDPEARFFVLDRNHPATVELALAAARAGVCCVIGNWRLAPAELEYAVNDSAATAMFVGAELADAVRGLLPKLPLVRRLIVVDGPGDELEALIAGATPLAAPARVDADAVCLQLYTSGTTGFPKGAMLTHRGLAAHTEMGVRVFRFDEGSINLVPMPLFHVGGISWSLVGLRTGGLTVIARDPSPPSLVRDVARYRVTHTFVVPAILAGLVAMPDLREHDLSSLKTVLYGASPIAVPLLERCLAALPCGLTQVYGMTELCGVITVLDEAAHRDSAHPERLASAGQVAPGIELRVVDPVTLQDAAAGAQGELWWRSEQRMAGYWGKPEATAETIVAGGWLRSGDVGAVVDGFVFLHDRVKDMAISGGENVYPAEVERVLQQHAAVADVAVYGVPDERWGEVLRAAVVRHPGKDVDAEELVAFCRERLAHYKCPRAVDFLEALPRNATGKVLKRDLRAPFWEGRTRAL